MGSKDYHPARYLSALVSGFTRSLVCPRTRVTSTLLDVFAANDQFVVPDGKCVASETASSPLTMFVWCQDDRTTQQGQLEFSVYPDHSFPRDRVDLRMLSTDLKLDTYCSA